MSEVPKSSTINTFSQSKDLLESSHNDITKLYIPIIKRFEIPRDINQIDLWSDQIANTQDKLIDKQKNTHQKISTKKQKEKIYEKNQGTEPFETCNCIRSNCLKLYCVCFSSGNLCGNSCLCRNCKNSHDNLERSESILQIIQRDATAFSKGYMNPSGKTSCNCKRSNCLKNYCQCYKNGSSCSEECCCFDCKNNKNNSNHNPFESENKVERFQIPQINKKSRSS